MKRSDSKKSPSTPEPTVIDIIKGALQGIFIVLVAFFCIIGLLRGCASLMAAEVVEVRPSSDRTIAGLPLRDPSPDITIIIDASRERHDVSAYTSCMDTNEIARYAIELYGSKPDVELWAPVVQAYMDLIKECKL